jgi:hypothetical protein
MTQPCESDKQGDEVKRLLEVRQVTRTKEGQIAQLATVGDWAHGFVDLIVAQGENVEPGDMFELTYSVFR